MFRAVLAVALVLLLGKDSCTAVAAAIPATAAAGCGSEAECGVGVTDQDESLELLQRRGAKVVPVPGSENEAVEAIVQAIGENMGEAVANATGGEADAAEEAAAAAASVEDTSATNNTAGLQGVRPSLMRSFKRLFASCDFKYGSPDKCSEMIVGGAMDVFDVIQSKYKGDENFTDSELLAFRARFKKALTEQSKKLHYHKFIWNRYDAFKQMSMKAFSEMRPAISESLVWSVAAENLGWKAEFKPHHVKASMADLKNQLGLEVDPAEEADQIVQANASHMADLLQLGSQEEPQGPFDVAEHWPECSNISKHVRFQTCANCWSHSTALISEMQVCIMTAGKFMGRDAWLSQSYVAACRVDGRDYCAGGSGTLGFHTVTTWGAPTGASDDRGNADPEADTCYPQIPPHLRYVSCPAECAQGEDYPRDLHHDTFFMKYESPRSLYPLADLTPHLVKTHLMEHGPIMIGFRAYQDLLAYVDGVYKPAKSKWNRSIGGHAVTGMGFGPDYWLCTNSWGDSWGLKGQFKMHTSVVNIGYYLPGKMTYGKYGRFPIPLP